MTAPITAAALSLLRHSCDADRDAAIWHDDGRTVTRLAQDAGVTVEYIHCNLTALACERRRVETKGDTQP